MAEAIYNKITRTDDADSAGTHVEFPGESLSHRKKRLGKSYVVDVMNQHGYNFDEKIQRQLTQEMLASYDLVVSMAAKRYTPKWLLDCPTYTYWKILDPGARGYETTNRTRRLIEAKVKELVQP